MDTTDNELGKKDRLEQVIEKKPEPKVEEKIPGNLGQVILETEKTFKKSPFTDLSMFQDYQRMAQALSKSKLVPKAYQNNIADCIIAMEIADRVGSSPLMVMQSLYVVHGNPGWSAQWVIAMLNSCGRFSPVQFDLSLPDDDTTTVEYTEFEWNKSAGKKLPTTKTIDIKNRRCTARIRDLKTGEILYGPEVSLIMAVKEGWYTKPGSKWQTMEGVMFMYRSASFLGKLYAPDLLMGLQTAEELKDMRDEDFPSNKTVDNTSQTNDNDELNKTIGKIADKKKNNPSKAAAKAKPKKEPEPAAPVDAEPEVKQADNPNKVTLTRIARMLKDAKTDDDIDVALDLSNNIENPVHKQQAVEMAVNRLTELSEGE